jgi:predicted RNase H-like HicB family nuclease
MTTLHAIILRSENNYGAYLKEVDGIIGIGDTLQEVKKSLLESIDITIEECAMNPEYVLPEEFKGDYEVVFSMDVLSFMEYYAGILSNAGLQRITGINQKQLGHYASGLSKPRAKQRARIEAGLHRLGEELLSIRFDSDSN